jgi:hypothetical protein
MNTQDPKDEKGKEESKKIVASSCALSPTKSPGAAVKIDESLAAKTTYGKVGMNKLTFTAATKL